MDRNDQQAIEDLFRKLADVERQAQPRDTEAEDFIRDQIARHPGAPYYMAQTIVVQEQALEAAQRRIEELEQGATEPEASGGLFGGLFGGGNQGRATRSVPRVGRQAAAERPSPQYQRGGGGFLAGAAQTAMGVAGGILLGNVIAGMFDGGEAQAAEPPADEPGAEDASLDDGGFDDGGGDFGDLDI